MCDILVGSDYPRRVIELLPPTLLLLLHPKQTITSNHYSLTDTQCNKALAQSHPIQSHPILLFLPFSLPSPPNSSPILQTEYLKMSTYESTSIPLPLYTAQYKTNPKFQAKDIYSSRTQHDGPLNNHPRPSPPQTRPHHLLRNPL